MNIVDPKRRRPWTSAGAFVIGRTTTKGFEMVPNWNLRIVDDVTTVNLDIENPAATDTYYQNGRSLAGYIQTMIRASGLPSASSYTVIYDDEKQSPHIGNATAPTFKWKIASNTARTFTLIQSTDANSILPSIGWPIGAVVAATSQTSDNIAIHTEESLVLDLGATPGLSINAGSITIAQARWLVLVDCDWSCDNEGDTAGQRKTRLYTSTGLTSGPGVDNIADSAYTLNTNFFKLASKLGTYEGQDTFNNVYQSADTPPTPRYWVIDLYSWKGSNPVMRYLRLKIVDRQNASGHVSLGYAFFGPGWYPAHNIEWGPDNTVSERRSRLELSIAGSHMSKFRNPSGVYEMKWAPYSMTDNDQLLLRNWFLRSGVGAYANSGWTAATGTLAGWARPVIFLDPGYCPTGSDRLADTRSLYARGAMFGRASLGKLSQSGLNAWGLQTMIFEEEPF